MSERGRLVAQMRAGQVLRPCVSPNFADLTQALLRQSGCGHAGDTPSVRRLCRLIGNYERYVLVLVDGLGMRQLQQHCPEGFLAAHRKATLNAVFPSTTASALTTLATGVWPARHGALGWWLRLSALRRSIVTLPFVERDTNVALERLGIRIEEVLTTVSRWGRLGDRVCSVVPERIVPTAYSRYASGNTKRIGYRTISGGLNATVRSARSRHAPTLTYLYLPHLDTLMHTQGPCSPESGELLRGLDRALEQCARLVAGRARLIVVADHGQIDVPPDKNFCLPAADPLVGCLDCLPTGEPRVPFFHITRGKEREFFDRFLDRFSEDFTLLDRRDLQALRLFGPAALSRHSLCRLGSAVAVPLGSAKLHVQPAGESLHNRGAHGGLSPEEMLVPLVIV